MSVYIFDTETTGFTDTAIVEAAWIKVSAINNLFSPDGVFVQRYNPGKPIECGALATHHILDEELDGWPHSSEFQLPADAEYLVGHNVDYDWRAIGSPEIKRICTSAISKELWKGADSHSQSALLYFLSEDRIRTREKLKNAHSAMQDVENCLELLHHIIVATGVTTWEALYELSEKSRIPTIMPFGKHSGEEIKSIPSGYKSWALANMTNLDPYLRIALGGKNA